LLKRIGLDLLCVAAHYSKCYDNSDKFIEGKADDELRLYTYYVKNTNPNAIVSEFCDKYINQDTYTTDSHIEWKNLHFVWKQFLSNTNLPSVIYSNNLKNMLKERYNYNETNDSFYGITSKHIPIHSDFIKFWENTITVAQISNEFAFDNEFEIDELSSLFKLWAKNGQEQLKTNGNISEENILKILKHFYPSVEIIEDKYVLNIACNLWDKIKHISDSIMYIKEQLKLEQESEIISFDTIYGIYCKYAKNTASKYVVSKRYFEKYLYNKFAEFIAYDKFITINWVNT
jgi:hypothetical protein